MTAQDSPQPEMGDDASSISKGDDRGSDGGPAAADSARPSRPQYAPPARDTFDWRGWVLVGVVAVCFLVIPASILYLPQAEPLIESLGLSLRDAYLTLPMVPALILGAIAVWSAVASRRPE